VACLSRQRSLHEPVDHRLCGMSVVISRPSLALAIFSNISSTTSFGPQAGAAIAFIHDFCAPSILECPSAAQRAKPPRKTHSGLEAVELFPLCPRGLRW